MRYSFFFFFKRPNNRNMCHSMNIIIHLLVIKSITDWLSIERKNILLVEENNKTTMFVYNI